MVDEFTLNGFLLIDKPQGITSQQAVTRVKKALGVHRVGHGGTLDPMATGLLVVGVGRATRLLGYIADKNKKYEGSIRLGQATSTDDAEGEPLGEVVDATRLSHEDVHTAMSRYLGEIEQIPSAVSAIKVGGRRAYDRVRRGEVVELKARPVVVTDFDLRNRTDNSPWVDLDVAVTCSSGTYIRALARDLGRDLGVGGHLTALRRTQVGKLSVEDAIGLDGLGLGDVRDIGELAEHIAPRIQVDETQLRDIAVGRGINLTLPAGLTAVFYKAQLLALYHPDPQNPNRAVPVAVFIDPTDRRLQVGMKSAGETGELKEEMAR